MSVLLSRRQVRDLLAGLALALTAAALLLFPAQSMTAARTGLSLCANVIVPSLFPFFVLSSLVTELGLSDYLGRALRPVMRGAFNVPGACAAALVLGFVGGYPVGARTALALYEQGACTKTEAERLLAFCNNSGPAFIFGVVGAGIFADSRVALLLYLAHGAASLCVGLLFRFYRRGADAAVPAAPAAIRTARFSTAFTGAVAGALRSTLGICAFVVTFTVILRLLFLSGVMSAAAGGLALLFSPLGLDRAWAEKLLTGVLELSSGVWTLSGGGVSEGQVAMAAFLLGWAGLSVHCQVLSFLGGSGLSPRTYLAGKALHGVFSALLIKAAAQVFPLRAEVGSYLARQVDAITALDFGGTLAICTACAWTLWLFFFAVALTAAKKSGKGRRGVVQ